MLRVKMVGVGCCGPVYELGLVQAGPGKDDVAIETNGVHLVVDKESLRQMRGTVIDYGVHPVFRAEGFLFDNPLVPEEAPACSGCQRDCER